MHLVRYMRGWLPQTRAVAQSRGGRPGPRRRPAFSPRAAILFGAVTGIGALAALTGCGGTARRTVASTEPTAVSSAPAAVGPSSAGRPAADCTAVAMDELGHVAMHIYHEGVSSVTTRSAQRFVIES